MVVSWSVGQKDLRSKQRTKLDCQKNGGVTTFPSASVGSDVWARVNGQVPRLTRLGKLTAHATPWETQFRDDIEALKEF